MSDLHRLKHAPTGLYFVPGKENNLSKTGKVYFYKHDALEQGATTLRVKMQKTCKLFKEHPELLTDYEWKTFAYHSCEMYATLEFEREPLEI